ELTVCGDRIADTANVEDDGSAWSLGRPTMARRDRVGWEPCPAGEIERLAQRLRRRRQRRRFLGVAGVLTAAAAVGGVSWWLGFGASDEPAPGSFGDFTYAGIRCSRVRAQADAYGKGALSDALREQIRKHL